MDTLTLKLRGMSCASVNRVEEGRKYTFRCGMNMFRGVLEVQAVAPPPSKAASSPVSVHSPWGILLRLKIELDTRLVIEPLLFMGQVAEKTRISIKMIRDYEDLGLLHSSGRTEAGFAHFHQRFWHVWPSSSEPKAYSSACKKFARPQGLRSRRTALW